MSRGPAQAMGGNRTTDVRFPDEAQQPPVAALMHGALGDDEIHGDVVGLRLDADRA